MERLQETSFKTVIQITAILAAIVLATRFGGLFRIPPSGISIFWPPNAILLSAALILDRRDRLRCLVLALPAYFVAELWIGFEPAASFTFALANCLGVGAGVFLISRYAGLPFHLITVRQVFIFMSMAGVAAMISATIGAAHASGADSSFLMIFERWALADFVGYLVIGPVILTWDRYRQWRHLLHGEKLLEGGVYLTLFATCLFAIYGGELHGVHLNEGFGYLPIPILLWGALRFGAHCAAISLFALTITAISLTILGAGPFHHLPAEEYVEALQIFLPILTVSILTVAILVEERNAALNHLTKTGETLENIITARTENLREEARQHKKALDDLNLSELKFTKTFHASPGLFAISTLKDGIHVTVNDQWVETLGYSREEAIGKTAAQIGVWESPEYRQRLVKELKKDGRIRNLEAQLQTKSGEIRDVLIAAELINLDGVDHILVVSHDITERKQAEKALQQSEEQLRQSQKMEAVGKLTGGIAHEFNNLLLGVLGPLELIKEVHGKDPKIRKWTEMGIDGALRGRDLIKDLLAFSRQKSLEVKPTNVNEDILKVAASLGRTLGENVHIKTSLADKPWATLINSGELEAALLNLSINARDAMPDGGSLTYKSTNRKIDKKKAEKLGDMTPGNYVVVSLSDTGEGMSEEVLQHAFDPFFTTKEVGKGSGLGLSMVYGFAKQAGGTALIETKIGHGTTINIFLPQSLESVDDDARSAIEEDTPHGTETILLVEDDITARMIGATILKDLGYTVIKAKDGLRALDILEGGKNIDLLLSDIVMPGGMSGVNLAKKVHKHYRNIKILLCTGYNPEEVNLPGQENEKFPILEKPYRKSELARRVRKILDGMI